MKPDGYLLGLALTCGLLGCDRGSGRQDSMAGPIVDAAASPLDVDAYLQRFSAGDANACFGDASLGTAIFRNKPDTPSVTPVARVLVAVDASGSMSGRVSGRSKLELAQAAAKAFIQGLPAEAEVGLLVFGQAGDNTLLGKAKSCAAVSLAVPLSRGRNGLVEGISAVKAIGWTPLSTALRQAETFLARGGKPGEQVIYVVSDGQETCGGDPVAVARAINGGPTKAVVNIIGFAVPDGEAAALAAVASAGGGQFVNVDTDSEVNLAAASIREGGRTAANTLAESGATARNGIATSGAVAKAQLCTSSIIARERTAIGTDIATKRIAGRDVALEERAEKILAERHEALELRMKTFEEQLDGRLENVSRGVAANAAGAR